MSAREFFCQPTMFPTWCWWAACFVVGSFGVTSIHFYFQARLHKMYAATFAKWAKEATEENKRLKENKS